MHDSLKHWVAKSIMLFELEKLGHEVDIEVDIPGIGVADIIDMTTRIQYEIDGNHSPSNRNKKARKYLRPGINDVIVVPIHKLSTDIFEIQSYVREYIVPD